MLTTKLESNSHCPACKAQVDGATSVPGEYRPRPGDITVCGFCAAILAFTDDMALRVFGLDELLELPPSLQKHVLKVRSMVLTIRSQRERKGS